ncbi:coiled-coil domain-containing protein 174 [Scaptodrosophila lebanonensis]|uniref:Coiled-coil domain-containing protein 174 n=1 Tax=Drosophila lebanonensis TaxID=7225 RepID=A0A6J2TE17_DROLE|nr:coiled-coil domain-containing protein 174 [Scaptodrosophila lebanonensis]
MNDPNKAISVNLSSLLSLKTELLRKQQEVKVAKATKTCATDFRPTKNSGAKSSSKKEQEHRYKEVSRDDNAKVYETEDAGQLEKSRRVLEAKSKFYDRMSRSGGSLNSDDNCLVMFNRKRQEEAQSEDQEQGCALRERLSSSSSDSSNAHDEGNDDDEVEYTDCLGRTRKCLRKDLAEAKRRDKQLAESMPERLDQTKANWMIDVKGAQSNNSDDGEANDEPDFGPRPTESVCSDLLSTMTKHDEQRLNWERQEQENFDKMDVHYQDVFFDEARTHGVGYYAFSTDEAERKEQQKKLEEARKATQAEQARRDALRVQRDRLVADRVLAAKNRLRARNGLPPISKEEYENEQQLKASEAATDVVEKEREREKEQELKEIKAHEEAIRDELRKAYVRDWDKDKSGVAKPKNVDDESTEWKYKAERLPMSQEQWNEKQRTLRQKEFAPMPEADPTPLKRTNFHSAAPSTSFWTSNASEDFSMFHSTKREKQFQRRSYQSANEYDNDASPTTSQAAGATIPPPDDLDAASNGPPESKRAKSQSELERSIEAGLKFLRKYCDKGVVGNKGTWVAKADY